MEEKIQKLMKSLEITREEALELIEDDRKIDKGEKLFEQSAEQKKATKKYTSVAKAVNAYGKTVTRTRKADDDKRYLINALAESLAQLEINHDVTNIEREINLIYNDRKFKIVLSAPRT